MFFILLQSHLCPAYSDPASLYPSLSVKKHTYLKFRLSQQFILHSFLVMVCSLHSFQIFAHYTIIISHHHLQPHPPSSFVNHSILLSAAFGFIVLHECQMKLLSLRVSHDCYPEPIQYTKTTFIFHVRLFGDQSEFNFFYYDRSTCKLPLSKFRIRYFVDKSLSCPQALSLQSIQILPFVMCALPTDPEYYHYNSTRHVEKPQAESDPIFFVFCSNSTSQG